MLGRRRRRRPNIHPSRVEYFLLTWYCDEWPACVGGFTCPLVCVLNSKPAFQVHSDSAVGDRCARLPLYLEGRTLAPTLLYASCLTRTDLQTITLLAHPSLMYMPFYGWFPTAIVPSVIFHLPVLVCSVVPSSALMIEAWRHVPLIGIRAPPTPLLKVPFISG